MNILRFKCIPIYLSIFCKYIHIDMYIHVFVYIALTIDIHTIIFIYYMIYIILRYLYIDIYIYISIYLLYILHTGVRHSKPAPTKPKLRGAWVDAGGHCNITYIIVLWGDKKRGWAYIYTSRIYHLYIAYWVIIYHLPPIKGTRNSCWGWA